jgi:hypothetical protein
MYPQHNPVKLRTHCAALDAALELGFYLEHGNSSAPNT